MSLRTRRACALWGLGTEGLYGRHAHRDRGLATMVGLSDKAPISRQTDWDTGALLSPTGASAPTQTPLVPAPAQPQPSGTCATRQAWHSCTGQARLPQA